MVKKPHRWFTLLWLVISIFLSKQLTSKCTMLILEQINSCPGSKAALICTTFRCEGNTSPDSKVQWAHLGPTGPRWVPCGPREPCCLGWYCFVFCYIFSEKHSLHPYTTHKELLTSSMKLDSNLIARFMGPMLDPSLADKTQVGPMLAHELCYPRSAI